MKKIDLRMSLANDCLSLRFSFLFLLFATLSQAQSSWIPIGSDQEYYIERLCIQYGAPDHFQRNLKPYHRKDIIELLHYWDSLQVLQDRDLPFVQYMCNENNEWLWQDPRYTNSPDFLDSTYYTSSDDTYTSKLIYKESDKPVLGYFYRTPANLIHVNKKDFYLRLNPIINVQGGREMTNGENIIANQRGADLRIGLDDKIYVQTSILENQFSYPAFYRNKIAKFNAVPGAGFFKLIHRSSLYTPLGYDYFIANAQLGIRVSKHFHMQLGHGSQFIGDGIRSSFLSDYAQEFFFLKLNTRIWKFTYQNTFAELAVNSYSSASVVGNVLTPKKYMAMHTLQISLFPNWNVGLFESVLFHRKDHFEFQYLNPVIIYRSVEGSIGSPDNVMLGLNTRYDVNKSISVYGQLLIDEFLLKEVFKNNGYWGNKFGYQAGVKYLNVLGIDRLDVQAEYNTTRPYTYSHFDSTANYTHQSTPMAHPLGANFKEVIFKLKYQPTIKWSVQLYAMRYHWGDDPINKNYGSNLTKSYLTRDGDFGQKTTQGIARKIFHVGATFSYQLFHNYFLDLNTYYRKDPNIATETSKYIGGGIRINWWRKDLHLL